MFLPALILIHTYEISFLFFFQNENLYMEIYSIVCIIDTKRKGLPRTEKKKRENMQKKLDKSIENLYEIF